MATPTGGDRLISLFQKGPDGLRPYQGQVEKASTDEHFESYHQFFEYFDGDTGRGLGAAHQTGWTGLVAELIEYVYAFKTERVAEKV